MSYKIAIGSNDNKSVNQHFGTCEGFGIYIVDDNGGYKYSEYRKTAASCGTGEGHDEKMQNSVNTLADCRIVLINQAGPCAVMKLNAAGIQFLAVSGNIDQILPRLIVYLKKQNKQF
jgi:predicted Fe-Mo cluster-binding NifX family protein